VCFLAAAFPEARSPALISRPGLPRPACTRADQPSQINLDDVTLAAQPAPNANGGKFVSISLRGGRPEDILLGDAGTFSRVAFEPEQDKTKPEKWAMKGRTERPARCLYARAGVQGGRGGRDQRLAQAGPVHAVGGGGQRLTEVMVAPSLDALHEAEPGVLGDIKKGMLVLPILRTKGGVWFSGSAFGLSFEATNLLVVKTVARGVKRKLSGLNAFNLTASSDAEAAPSS
jgi:hypothetical protein